MSWWARGTCKVRASEGKGILRERTEGMEDVFIMEDYRGGTDRKKIRGLRNSVLVSLRWEAEWRKLGVREVKRDGKHKVQLVQNFMTKNQWSWHSSVKTVWVNESRIIFNSLCQRALTIFYIPVAVIDVRFIKIHKIDMTFWKVFPRVKSYKEELM